MVNMCVVESWIIKIKDNYWACPWNNLDMAGWLIKGEPVAWQDKKKIHYLSGYHGIHVEYV